MSLTFFSCKNETEEVEEKQGAGRTVIVYMVAENNLSEYASANISDIVAGTKGLLPNDRIVIFCDQHSSTPPQLTTVVQGGHYMVRQYDHDFNSTHPDTMRNILRHVVRTYPSQNYALVLWSHASGWIVSDDTVAVGGDAALLTSSAPRRSFGIDGGYEGGHTQSRMNIHTLARVLEDVGHTDFIMFDCCNMQCAEVAYELRKCTDYIVASPAEIPGEGAPYQSVVPVMFKESAEECAVAISDSYFNNMAIASHRMPISVVKTSEMERLAAATKEKLRVAYSRLDGKDPVLDSLVFYYRHDKALNRLPMMYDMNSCMRRLLADNDYKEWKEVFDQAVLAPHFSSPWPTSLLERGYDFYDFSKDTENYGGVSMFVPLHIYDYMPYAPNEKIKLLSWYYAVGWPDLFP